MLDDLIDQVERHVARAQTGSQVTSDGGELSLSDGQVVMRLGDPGGHQATETIMAGPRPAATCEITQFERGVRPTDR